MFGATSKMADATVQVALFSPPSFISYEHQTPSESGIIWQRSQPSSPVYAKAILPDARVILAILPPEAKWKKQRSQNIGCLDHSQLSDGQNYSKGHNATRITLCFLVHLKPCDHFEIRTFRIFCDAGKRWKIPQDIIFQTRFCVLQ